MAKPLGLSPPGRASHGPLCRLVVDPQWRAALEGIDRYAALQILYWMHEARRDLVRLSPRGGEQRGPFALRAPTRPNPIASSIVDLIFRQDNILTVRGLDCLDGTPLLDIKPWRTEDADQESIGMRPLRAPQFLVFRVKIKTRRPGAALLPGIVPLTTSWV